MSLGASIILNYDSFDLAARVFINDSHFLNNSAPNYLIFFNAIGSPKVDILLYSSSIFNCRSQEQVTKFHPNIFYN